MASDNLHELHELSRIEEMHSCNFIRTFGGCGYLRDGNGGGIRTEDDLRGNQTIDFLKNALFNLQVLEDGLNDEIGIPQLLDSGRPPDSAQYPILLLLGDFSPFYALCQKFVNGVQSFLHKLISYILHEHVISTLSCQVGNAAPHSASTYYTNFPNIHRGPSIKPIHLCTILPIITNSACQQYRHLGN